MTEKAQDAQEREALLEAALRKEWQNAHWRICGPWPHRESVRCVWPPPEELAEEHAMVENMKESLEYKNLPSRKAHY